MCRVDRFYCKGNRWALQRRRTAAFVIVFGLLITIQASQSPARTESPALIKSFKVHIPNAVLADLRRRLSETKWPDQLPATTWEYGADISRVRELADYWQKDYDWRAQEAQINRFDQFTTEIDGQTIYFIHERSPRTDAIPLMLIHGWPGSIRGILCSDQTTYTSERQQYPCL